MGNDRFSDLSSVLWWNGYEKKWSYVFFYNKTENDHETYQKFMDMLDNNKKILKPLYYEDDEGKVLIVFRKRRLTKLQDIICDIKVSELLKEVLNE